MTTADLVPSECASSEVFPLDIQLEPTGHPWHCPLMDGCGLLRQLEEEMKQTFYHLSAHSTGTTVAVCIFAMYIRLLVCVCLFKRIYHVKSYDIAFLCNCIATIA